ncbi:MAG: AAA family ATPase, partial [Bacteroidales bacterium]|nr:AAA family ATPase [Bacteroidales bacterium]
PDVFNILLQVLDDGRLTDNKGRIVDFKNTIIIMTSNIGSHLIQENFSQMTEGNEETVVDQTRIEVMDLLKKTIRPEFLNRIDEIIMFKPLSRNEISGIVRLQFEHVKAMLKKNNIELQITDKAIKRISDLGYDPQFGARPLKRVMQREILNELSKMILAGKVDIAKPVRIDSDDERFIFEN